MTNPFDDNTATFSVLVNDAGQHSLWPSFMDLPEGWRVTHGPDSRSNCLDHVERNWTDLRPRNHAG